MPKQLIKKTRNARTGKTIVPNVVDFYSTRQACSKIDVHPTSLKHAAARADSKSLWSTRGVKVDISADQYLLIDAQRKIGRYTYFRKDLFDKFATLYLQKESVQLAHERRDKDRQIKKDTQTFICNSADEVMAMAKALAALMKVDGLPFHISYAPIKPNV